MSVLPCQILKLVFPSAEVGLGHGPGSGGPRAWQGRAMRDGDQPCWCTAGAEADGPRGWHGAGWESPGGGQGQAGLWVPSGPQQAHTKLLRWHSLVPNLVKLLCLHMRKNIVCVWSRQSRSRSLGSKFTLIAQVILLLWPHVSPECCCWHIYCAACSRLTCVNELWLIWW